MNHVSFPSLWLNVTWVVVRIIFSFEPIFFSWHQGFKSTLFFNYFFLNQKFETPWFSVLIYNSKSELFKWPMMLWRSLQNVLTCNISDTPVSQSRSARSIHLARQETELSTLYNTPVPPIPQSPRKRNMASPRKDLKGGRVSRQSGRNVMIAEDWPTRPCRRNSQDLGALSVHFTVLVFMTN